MADYEPAPRGMLTQREWRASQIIRVTAIVTLTVLAIVGLLEFLFQIRTILLWVLIGVILAIALQPAVGWLERHRWNRILASLLSRSRPSRCSSASSSPSPTRWSSSPTTSSARCRTSSTASSAPAGSSTSRDAVPRPRARRRA